MAQFIALTSSVAVLMANNIDTDQIIPARYLKATDKAGMGNNLFADWRFNSDGSPKPDFPLNLPENKGAQILLAGDNFGCGSSREHAPWALTGYGFRAILSTSFADIFMNNALKNGLLPVKIDAATQAKLIDLLSQSPKAQVSISLEAQQVILPNGDAIPFEIDPFSRACLLRGVDELGYLLGFTERISYYESTHVYG